ncbi:MAG UNVERIFIED_CONTAM: glycosyltransferase family 39 protein [Planctomycetaceae bacterium]
MHLSREKATDLVVMAVSVAIVLCATLPDLMTGWFPHDEGQVGQAAERFLQGELPHRDFDDMYTGLLTVLHAGAFQLLGVRTESTRWLLLAASIPFFVSIYRVSRRWLSALDAGGMVVLCGMWSVRLNPESLPSWYILFLTVVLLDALLTFAETRQLRWLLAAGVLAGTAFLFKLTGIYLIAAGVLFLMDYEQRCCDREARRSFVFSGWISFCVLVYGLAASRLWSPRDPLMSAVHLTLPALGLCFFVLHGEWQRGRGLLRERGWRWLRLQSAFVCGVMLPVGSWLVWYWSEGALSALYEGLVVLPQRRLEHAGAAFPGPSSFLISGVLGAAVTRGLSNELGWNSRGQTDRRFRLLAVAVPCLLLAVGCLSDRGRLVCFHSVRNLGPVVAAALLVMLSRVRSQAAGSCIFAVVAMLVMGAMVQFPFALDSYFLYVAPLVFLGASLLVCKAETAFSSGRFRLSMGRMIVVACSLFAFLELKSIVPLGTVTGVPRSVGEIRLGLDRCGLTVERSLGDVYRRLVEEIQGLTESGESILAGPDCPEVYFLAQRRNPTRLFYDFFRPELLGAQAEIELLAEREGVRLVVVKQPYLLEFSRESRELEAWARERFGEPRAFRFAEQPDSAGPVLFNVYADRSDVKVGELARRE